MSESEQMLAVLVGGGIFVVALYIRARLAARRAQRRQDDQWNR